MAEDKKITKEREKELLEILGKILIFEFYNGNAPSPKKVQEMIGVLAKETDIPEGDIREGYLYARMKSEEMAFKDSSGRIGFQFGG